LTVADLFCGAGGFSEGFAQAGFRIKWAIDNWSPAVETYRKNHPSVDVTQGDILATNPSDFPRVDVVIGSPPCVHFSLANRGGNGNRETGLELVNRFLTFVEELHPKYWVMENVPNLALLLRQQSGGESARSTAEKMANVPTVILDTATYGAPQHRRRMFSGDFPVPPTTNDGMKVPFVPLRRILSTLPNPTVRNDKLDARISDPIYPRLKVRSEQLRDHFEDLRWRLSRYERQRAKQQKLGNFVYGKMSYPDDIDKPSRTITATRTGGSRSTIVVPMGERNVRTLTMREAACAQGFPISYQFWARSMSDKDALVGNAVSPIIARAIANSILNDSGRPLLTSPLLDSSPSIPAPLVVHFKRFHRFPVRRRFRGVVPIDMRPNHRVELDNRCALAPPGSSGKGEGMGFRWTSRLYLGYATKYKSYELDREASVSLARAALQLDGQDSPRGPLISFLVELSKFCNAPLPSAIDLQQRWSGRRTSGISPDYYCSSVGTLVERFLPAKAWRNQFVSSAVTEPILNRVLFAQGTKAGEGQPLEMSIRLLASSIGIALLCSGINDRTQFPRELLAAFKKDAPMTRVSVESVALTLDDVRWTRKSDSSHVSARQGRRHIHAAAREGSHRAVNPLRRGMRDDTAGP
jgi:DNA-cytosine methyltransferase